MTRRSPPRDGLPVSVHRMAGCGIVTENTAPKKTNYMRPSSELIPLPLLDVAIASIAPSCPLPKYGLLSYLSGVGVQSGGGCAGTRAAVLSDTGCASGCAGGCGCHSGCGCGAGCDCDCDDGWPMCCPDYAQTLKAYDVYSEASTTVSGVSMLPLALEGEAPFTLVSVTLGDGQPVITGLTIEAVKDTACRVKITFDAYVIYTLSYLDFAGASLTQMVQTPVKLTFEIDAPVPVALMSLVVTVQGMAANPAYDGTTLTFYYSVTASLLALSADMRAIAYDPLDHACTTATPQCVTAADQLVASSVDSACAATSFCETTRCGRIREPLQIVDESGVYTDPIMLRKPVSGPRPYTVTVSIPDTAQAGLSVGSASGGGMLEGTAVVPVMVSLFDATGAMSTQWSSLILQVAVPYSPDAPYLVWLDVSGDMVAGTLSEDGTSVVVSMPLSAQLTVLPAQNATLKEILCIPEEDVCVGASTVGGRVRTAGNMIHAPGFTSSGAPEIRRLTPKITVDDGQLLAPALRKAVASAPVRTPMPARAPVKRHAPRIPISNPRVSASPLILEKPPVAVSTQMPEQTTPIYQQAQGDAMTAADFSSTTAMPAFGAADMGAAEQPAQGRSLIVNGMPKRLASPQPVTSGDDQWVSVPPSISPPEFVNQSPEIVIPGVIGELTV